MTLLLMAVIMDRDRISALSTESGFPPGPLEKVIRLGEVAASVARHPLLSRVLALEGGTALNLFDGPRQDCPWIWTSTTSAPWTGRRCSERAVNFS